MKEWRRRAKIKLLLAFGGCCCICGYNRSVGALHFHHVDPEKKSFGIAASGKTRAYEKMVEEAKKCVLICANCHAEVHDDLYDFEFLEAKRRELEANIGV